MTDVVVTGVGVVSPLGMNLADTCAAVATGSSALQPLPAGWWSAEGHLTPHEIAPRDTATSGDWPAPGEVILAGRVPWPPWSEGVWPTSSSLPQPGSRLQQWGQWAAQEALSQSGLLSGKTDPERIGVIWGLSKGDLSAAARWLRQPRQISDFWSALPIAPTLRDLSADAAAHTWIGPRTTVVAACASGLVAVLRGVQWIQQQRCDAVLVVSADAGIHPAVIHSFRKLGVLSPALQDSQHTQPVRPFAADHDGFLIGEGGAAFVLERADNPRPAGAGPLVERGQPLARWVCGGEASDACGLTQADPSGRTLGELLKRLGAHHQTGQQAVYHLHGTATPQNDGAEAAALGRFQSPHHPLQAVALKGALGHLLGGAGAVELALAIEGLRTQQWLPSYGAPTVTECGRLQFCRVATPAPHDRIWKISSGFGGHVAAVSLARMG